MNYTADGCREPVLRLTESIIFLLLGFAALWGNLLIVVAFYRKRSLRTVTNYLVLSLTVADLLRAFLNLALHFIASATNKWMLGEFGCIAGYVCCNIVAGTSLLTVMQMAVNRYLHLTKPALRYKLFNKKYCIFMILSTWTSTAVLVIGNTFSSKLRFKLLSYQPTVCFIEFASKKTGFYVSVLSRCLYVTVPAMVVVICYVKIYQTICAYKLSERNSMLVKSAVCAMEKVKTTRIVTVIVIAFYVCWLPVCFSILALHFGLITTKALKYWNFFYTFPVSVSSAINPIICAFMSRRFRHQFGLILKCRIN